MTLDWQLVIVGQAHQPRGLAGRQQPRAHNVPIHDQNRLPTRSAGRNTKAAGDVVKADLGALGPLPGDVLAPRGGAHPLVEAAHHFPAVGDRRALGVRYLGEVGRYTAAANTAAVYAYSDNYLVDLKHAVIVDVEATTAIRQAEVGAAKTMLDRTAEQFDVRPSRLVADAGYGSAGDAELAGG